MDNTRNYVLDRLRSQKISIEEFNFERLMAPPLAMFLSPYDIAQLNQIASSIKLSGKPEIRYKEIDKIMKSRGLVKFGAGTNRVVYRHPEFQDIVFKVAADSIGLGDNPAEFRNQNLLKPFVCKCFEISPCGTVGVFERVNPITNREEFISVSDDVFELINEFLIGEYVLADIGSKFYQNFGIRRSFGVVLLDYPYVYKLDGNKLFCNKLDPLSPSGKCEGVIDYDDGYSFLKCTKCGAIYKAKELEAKMKTNEIEKRKGDNKMKITIKGGSANLAKESINTGITNDTFAGFEVKAPKATNTVSRSKSIKLGDASKEVKEEPVHLNVTPKARPVKEAIEKAEAKAVQQEVNGVGTTKPEAKPKQMISISEEVKKEAVENKKEAKSPVEQAELKMKEIANLIKDIDIDTVRNGFVKNLVSFAIGYLSVSDKWSVMCSELLDSIDDLPDTSEMVDIVNNDYMKEIVERLFDVTVNFDSYERVDDDIDVVYNTAIVVSDPEATTVNVAETSSSVFHMKNVYLGLVEDATEEADEDVEVENVDDVVENPDTEEVQEELEDGVQAVEGIRLFSAIKGNLQDIVAEEEDLDVLYILDQDGNYLTKDNYLIAVSSVDDLSLDESTIVSSEWVNSVANNDIAEVNEDQEEDEVENVASSIPVGVMPPVETSEVEKAMSVEEFLDKEEEESSEE